MLWLARSELLQTCLNSSPFPGAADPPRLFATVQDRVCPLEASPNPRPALRPWHLSRQEQGGESGRTPGGYSRGTEGPLLSLRCLDHCGPGAGAGSSSESPLAAQAARGSSAGSGTHAHSCREWRPRGPQLKALMHQSKIHTSDGGLVRPHSCEGLRTFSREGPAWALPPPPCRSLDQAPAPQQEAPLLP